jgi:histone H3
MEILQGCRRHSDVLQCEAAAIGGLQEAAEAYIIEIMEETNDMAIHGGRVTIQARDMRLVRKHRRRTEPWM